MSTSCDPLWPRLRSFLLGNPLGIAGLAMAVSGAAHLLLLAATGGEWEGARSARKPGLFGVSGGATAWSLAWLYGRLERRPGDRWRGLAVAVALTLEVAWTTVQFWRGAPSHFNRATPFDRIAEWSALALILAVSAEIFLLAGRSRRLPHSDPAEALAIRAGLGYLVAACLLGGVATAAGKANLAAGRPPETWGRAGVLKYPHGVVLHAVQTLPLLAWLLRRVHAVQPVRAVAAATSSHGLFLVFALRQTWAGRARTDVDLAGVVLALAAVLAAAFPAVVLAVALRRELGIRSLRSIVLDPCPAPSEIATES